MKLFKRILFTILFSLIYYYFFLPVINIHSFSFYIFLFSVYMFYFLLGGFNKSKNIVCKFKNFFPFKGFLVFGILFLVIILINVIYMPLFNASKYKNRIKIESDISFEDNVNEVDFNYVPLLDKESSLKLGDRVMGNMSELVSQFYVSTLYTQINYNNEIVRVTPLEYASVVKYFTNRSKGINGYIMVNSVTGEAKLIKLKKGMKYMPSAMFNEKLIRKLRFSYPTLVFDEINFEIDNNGKPYWVASIVKQKGIGMLRDISGVVILDAVTGESKKYNVSDVPTWVDHVYNSNIILEQVNDWGQYQKGYWNSIFGQKDVVIATDGYNYMTIGDDVYLYTGITSAISDESNIGFILCNMRTKETNFYKVSGAEEYSAMASAEGEVQEKGYKATFPLLINLHNRPTYLISLKDNAGLVKSYAFVDVVDYQKVIVSDSSKGIEFAASNYLSCVGSSFDNIEFSSENITISWIDKIYIDGSTYFYIIDSNNKRFRVNINIDKDIIPFLRVGDSINVKFTSGNGVFDITRVS